MDRRKPPVLTSPWKIGFFVSLMLVTVSTGVAYFFMRNMNLSWQWFESELWTAIYSRKGFLIEMLPLLGLVVVASLLSFILITQAVRKYKRFLDSGLDYKNLLSSISEINDVVEDKGKIDRLKNHPELKAFLLGIRENVAKKANELEARENDFEKKLSEAAKEAGDAASVELAGECDKLIAAIQTRSQNSLAKPLGLQIPELQRVEEALRFALQADVGPGAKVDDLRQSGDALGGRISDVSHELAQSCQVAREIEHKLKAIAPGGTGHGTDLATTEKALQDVIASFASMDKLSKQLEDLGEDAKGIAINTALQAGSGKATQADVIQLAEDIKEVAGRFNDLAKSYVSLSVGAKGSMVTVEGFIARARNEHKDVSVKSLDAIAGKMSMWIERVMVLQEKITGGAAARADAGRSDAGEPAMDTRDFRSAESGDFGFETLGEKRALFSGSDDAIADLPGIEKRDDRGVFEEMSSEQELFAELSESGADRPVADPPRTTGRKPEDTAEEREAPSRDYDPNSIDFSNERKPAAQPAQPLPPVDNKPLPPAPEEPLAAKPSPAKKPPVIEEDDGILDLYAIGAVDYDPAVHQ